MGLKRGLIGGVIVSVLLICFFAQLELDPLLKTQLQAFSLLFIPFFAYDEWKSDKEE